MECRFCLSASEASTGADAEQEKQTVFAQLAYSDLPLHI
jgi:hypothetical protein